MKQSTMKSKPLQTVGNDTLSQVLKWSATVITLAGAVLTSLAIDPLNVYLLNLGSAIFLAWAWRIRDPAMIAVNAGLLVIYVVGTVRSLL
jgi:hypothetical protein